MIKALGSLGRLATLVIIAIALFFGYTVYQGIADFGIKRETKINVSGVLTQIKLISQLDTVEMYFNEILDYSEALKIKDIEIPFTQKKFIFFVKAKVQSGIDLSTLTENDIELDNKKITLTLNRAIITSKEILEYRAYYEKDGLFNKVSNEDTLKTLNEFLVRLDQQAIENGILQKAETNAEGVLGSFLKLLGFEEIVIKFKN